MKIDKIMQNLNIFEKKQEKKYFRRAINTKMRKRKEKDYKLEQILTQGLAIMYLKISMALFESLFIYKTESVLETLQLYCCACETRPLLQPRTLNVECQLPTWRVRVQQPHGS